jgi:hypothetical protein
MVSDSKHRAYHTLFRNWSPYQIARELNVTWIDPDYMLVAVRRDEYSGNALIG